MSRKIVYICSPLRADTCEDMQANSDELWVCGGRISEGMWREIGHAQELGIPVVYLDGKGRAEA